MESQSDTKRAPPKASILAQIPVSPANKKSNKKLGSESTPPQKMNQTRFEMRLENLLRHTEYSNIFYEKTILDIHHIIIINWRIFEEDILERKSLWGHSRRFSTFNREVVVQGYQKVKFQSSETDQKVLIYLRSVEKQSDVLRSHIPCFIPAAEIRKKQASLAGHPNFYSIAQRKRRKIILAGQRSNDDPEADSGKCRCRKVSRCHKLVQTLKIGSAVSSSESRGSQIRDKDRRVKSNSRKRKHSKEPSPNKIHSTMYLDRLKFIAAQKFLDSLIDEHVKSLLEIILEDILSDDQSVDSLDVLLWDPEKLPEKDVIKYLKEWSADKIQSIYSVHDINSRQPDIEHALVLLSKVDYNVEKALQMHKLGKYTIFMTEEDQESSSSTESEQNSEAQLNLRKVKMAPQKLWNPKMKFNFEKGLILFGEDVDKILKNFQCFHDLKPIDLDHYFYSAQRQKFIANPENSKKIVEILDQTPLSHLQKIEFFELGRDWAKIRQNIISSTSSSESEDSVEVTHTNKFGRIIRTVQPKKKRPKRLPDRYLNFQM